MFDKRYKKELEQQLNSGECKEAFGKLKSKYSIFDFYPTIETLRELFKSDNKNYTHKDKVMSIFLAELHGNKAIYPLINIIFWEYLCWLYCKKRTQVANPEELFNKIQEEFYFSIINHDVERLPNKININILFNTRKKIIAWQKENSLYKKALGEFEDLNKVGLSPFDLAKSKIYPEQMEEYLLDKVYQGIITETQYDLILETLVYKRMNQREWAKERDISYNTTRNLRYRAEMAIKSFEQKQRELKKSNFFCIKNGF